MKRLLLLLLFLPLLLGMGPISGGPITGGGGAGGGGTPLPADAPGSLINDGGGGLSWGVPATATALAANGTNCVAGQAPLGVNAAGNAEGCWAVQPYDAQLVDVASLVNPGNNYPLIWSGGSIVNGAAALKTWPATVSKPICNDGSGNPVACTNLTDLAFSGYTPAGGTGIVERIGATFDGGGSAIVLNKIAYAHIPFAVTTINQWTVVCDQDSGATGIVITPYMDAFATDTLPTTPMCTSGTKPNTTDGAGAGGTVKQAAWDCNITAIPADRIIAFKVTTAPTSATWCTVSLKVTR